MPRPPPPGTGLDQHRKPDLRDQTRDIVRLADRAVGSAHHRHAMPVRRAAGRRLVAHQPDRVGLGPDEDQPFGRATLCEIGIFREEPVARIDRVAARGAQATCKSASALR